VHDVRSSSRCALLLSPYLVCQISAKLSGLRRLMANRFWLSMLCGVGILLALQLTAAAVLFAFLALTAPPSPPPSPPLQQPQPLQPLQPHAPIPGPNPDEPREGLGDSGSDGYESSRLS